MKLRNSQKTLRSQIFMYLRNSRGSMMIEFLIIVLEESLKQFLRDGDNGAILCNVNGFEFRTTGTVAHRQCVLVTGTVDTSLAKL